MYCIVLYCIIIIIIIIIIITIFIRIISITPCRLVGGPKLLRDDGIY